MYILIPNPCLQMSSLLLCVSRLCFALSASLLLCPLHLPCLSLFSLHLSFVHTSLYIILLFHLHWELPPWVLQKMVRGVPINSSRFTSSRFKDHEGKRALSPGFTYKLWIYSTGFGPVLWDWTVWADHKAWQGDKQLTSVLGHIPSLASWVRGSYDRQLCQNWNGEGVNFLQWKEDLSLR